MPDAGPYKLSFDADTRRAIELALCKRVNAAVEGATDRNSQLQIWRDQLEGFGVTAQNQNWANACDLPDPISMEAFLTILSQIVGALHRDPKVAVEAFSSEDAESATVIEQWLQMQGSKSNIDARLYEFAHNACRDPAVVGYVGFDRITRKSREVGYKKPGSARVYTEDEREEDVEYEEVPLQEEVVEDRYVIRACELSDIYLYPPTAASIDRATAVAERMYVTEDELWDGIADYGYSRNAVEELVKLGPPAPSSDDDKETQDSQDGLNDVGDRDGYYELFTTYTRLPRVYDEDHGERKVPHYLAQDDFLCVLCPQRQIVLKLVFSPFKERPYFIGGILPKPEKSQGYGLMGMLEPLQCEANANLQFTIDSNNIAMAPALMVPESTANKWNKYSAGPGSIIPIPDGLNPSDVRPLEWGKAPLRDGLAWQVDLRNRAKALISAEGQGQLTGKVRKQGEIDNMQAQTSAKFGLYLTNFQRTVVAEVFRRMVLLKQQYDGDDDEEFVDGEGHSRTLTPAALRGKYNIVAVGTSLTHSPESRVEIAKQKQAVQVEYLTAKSKLPPDMQPLLWHGAREILMDLGERNPEAWIGEEPKAEAPQPAQPQQPQPMGNGTGQMPAMPMMGGGMGVEGN